MSRTISGAWILQLAVAFILLFVSFITLSINYTRAYAVKNELLSIIEKYEGVSQGNDGSVQIINNYLLHHKYSMMSECGPGYYGTQDLDSNTLEPTESNTKYYYCIKKVSSASNAHPKRAHYEVKVFFNFNLPLLGGILTFDSHGVSNDIDKPSPNDVFK